MDRHAIALLQRLAVKLPPELYAQVAEEIVEEFSGVPQPSIAQTLGALVSTPPSGAKRGRKPKTTNPRVTMAGGRVSRAGLIRELLQGGPKTTQEIHEALPEIPNEQLHPTLAAIRAVPVGSIVDAEGYTRKQYGFEPVTEVNAPADPAP